MKYRHLNEISKYFKPVDYIEELTPEEEKNRMILDGYTSSLERMKDFAERFTMERDSIVLTFYKTLYQTADDNLQLEFRNNYDRLNCEKITPDNIYSVILTAVLDFMYKMTSDKPYYHSNTYHNLNEYIGISASIAIRDNDSENEEIPDILSVVYIPDIWKYKDLICSENINGKKSELVGFSYREDYNNIISNNIDIPIYLVIDNIGMSGYSMNYFSECLVKLMSAESYYKYRFSKDVMTPVKAMVCLMETMDHMDHSDYTYGNLGKHEITRLCKSIKNTEAFNILIDYINDDIMFDVLTAVINLKLIFNIDMRDFKYLLCSSSTKRDFETALKNSIDNIADTYKEYLNEHSSAIKKQLDMFSDVVVNTLCINPNIMSISCTFLVPDTRVSPITNIGWYSLAPRAYGYSIGLVVR